jgi:precorrin-6A/cobalt-precorrin-6A reductase
VSDATVMPGGGPCGGRHLYLLGGTSFSRQLLAGLEDAGYRVRLSVATPLGVDEVDRPPSGGIQAGRLDHSQLAAEITAWEAAALVDATHPFAVEVSRTAREAAVAAGVPLFRATRPPWSPAAGSRGVRLFGSEAELVQELRTTGARALFTVGAKGLRPFAGHGIVLTARVLPTADSVKAALEAGVKPADLIAAYPPHGADFTAACMRHLGCSVIVSKESGAEGGLDEKIAAAELIGGQLFVVARPQEGVHVYHDITSLLKGMEDRWTRS